jgi:hypothetical protein
VLLFGLNFGPLSSRSDPDMTILLFTGVLAAFAFERARYGGFLFVSYMHGISILGNYGLCHFLIWLYMSCFFRCSLSNF